MTAAFVPRPIEQGVGKWAITPNAIFSKGPLVRLMTSFPRRVISSQSLGLDEFFRRLSGDSQKSKSRPVQAAS